MRKLNHFVKVIAFFHSSLPLLHTLSVPVISCDSNLMYGIITRYRITHVELFLPLWCESKECPSEFLYNLWFLNCVLTSSVTEVNVHRCGVAFVECRSDCGICIHIPICI